MVRRYFRTYANKVVKYLGVCICAVRREGSAGNSGCWFACASDVEDLVKEAAGMSGPSVDICLNEREGCVYLTGGSPAGPAFTVRAMAGDMLLFDERARVFTAVPMSLFEGRYKTASELSELASL